MPILEKGMSHPEEKRRHRGPCLVYTLESMFGKILGESVVAPRIIYDIRDKHALEYDRNLRQFRRRQLSLSNLWGMLDEEQIDKRLWEQYATFFHRDQELLTTEVIPAWIANDPQISDFLSQLQFNFLNLSYWRACQLARSQQVGLVIGVLVGSHHPLGHIFHLSYPEYAPNPVDSSDPPSLANFINDRISNQNIVDMTEFIRELVGFSALVVS